MTGPLVCQECWAVVLECACCVGPDGREGDAGCCCGVTVCVRCAEAACDDALVTVGAAVRG